MRLYVCMRKDNKMVSLNPEYGIEVTTLSSLADEVKDSNPELYNILTVLVASIIATDEKTLVTYINSYLEDKVSSDKIKDSINKMLDEYQNGNSDMWDNI